MRSLVVAIALTLSFAGGAAEPVSSAPNTCTGFGGQSDPCNAQADCSGNLFASRCTVGGSRLPNTGTCQVPCEMGQMPIEADHDVCAIGETCVQSQDHPSMNQGFSCRPTQFRMDLNLLDQCIAHHLDGIDPSLSSQNQCSLQANLNRLLDQNGDNDFDIFDVDLCVLSFLEQPVCEADNMAPTGFSCADPALVPCANDGHCGDGLFCDIDRHLCQRECGIIQSRENGFGALERKCSGPLTACDFARGRCVAVDPTQQTCSADAGCPSGAYCFLGRCASKCYRSTDCPSHDWYCSTNNRCRARPTPDAGQGVNFDPKDFISRFGRDELLLNAVDQTDSSRVFIINKLTRREVINPALSLGYRLELDYDRKQDAKCLKPFVDCSDPAQRPPGEDLAACTFRQDDCLISSNEEWIRLDSPFGVINASATPTISVTLAEVPAGALTPGTYTATLRAIYENGDQDTVQVRFTKASPSGEYVGGLDVFLDSPSDQLNGRPLNVALRLFVTDTHAVWNQLMFDNNVSDDATYNELSFEDTFSGSLVRAQLHGSDVFAFTKGGVESAVKDEIEMVGIYNAELGVLRLLGVIDIEPDFCIAAGGGSCTGSPGALEVSNPFRRKIRRVLFFTGPFNDALGTFSGVYREAIHGLVPSETITFQGSFTLQQTLADESPIDAFDPLIAANDTGVTFLEDDPLGQVIQLPLAHPTHMTLATLLNDIENEIEKRCGTADPSAAPDTGEFAAAQFASVQAFSAYVQQARRRGKATETSQLGRTTIFPGLVEFETAISDNLASLGGDPIAQVAHLNIYDFLTSRLEFCDSKDPTPAPACIDEQAVRCGLALHQKALLRGFVQQGLVADNADEAAFCIDTIDTDGCAASAGSSAESRALFVMQEHNRFWLNLEQVRKFDADSARSDAFLVLFRNEVNPFAQGAALQYKRDRLEDAFFRYNEALDSMVGPAETAVLFEWPAGAFATVGQDWLKILHSIAADRMTVLAELVDLHRRLLLAETTTDFVFAQHLMQHEYLVQALLMALEHRWRGELFAYKGEASPIFEQGQIVVNQLDPTRNPIGFTDGLVYFESTDPKRSNWAAYMDRIVGTNGEGGMLAKARASTAEAVANLQGALTDLDTFEATMNGLASKLDATRRKYCGDPELIGSDQCDKIREEYGLPKIVNDVDEKLKGDVATEGAAVCDDDAYEDPEVSFACQMTATKFISASGKLAKCTFGDVAFTATIGGLEQSCMGGTIGALLRERKRLLGQADSKISSVVSKVAAFHARVEATKIEEDQFDVIAEGKIVFDVVKQTVSNVKAGIKIVKNISEAIADIPDCVIIAGFAVGTDCAGNGVKVAAQVVAESLLKVATASLDAGIKLAENQFATVQKLLHKDMEKRARHEQFIKDARAIVALASGVNTIRQEIFDNAVSLEEQLFMAKRDSDVLAKDVLFAANHLVGRESGFVLKGDALVSEASTMFRDIVQTCYRLAVAYAHGKNLSPALANAWKNQALALVTLDEVEAFVEAIRNDDEDYCGAEGIDCDAANNTSVLRISLRDYLFPNLRDVIDPQTNAVVTAGQQFSQLVQLPPYLKRRVRGVFTVDQIELPVPVPLTVLENTKNGAPQWLVDPLTCNHLLDPSDPAAELGSVSGNVAVNVLGSNLPSDRVVRYELVREATDYVRSCHPESIQEEVGTLPVEQYPIRIHRIGYAPQSSEASQSSPPEYSSRSTPFPACTNQPEANADLVDAPCWRFFARDRSLASLGWKFVVPVLIDNGQTENTWIGGDGLPAAQVPVIEDIVFYFRYRSRPLSNQ